MIYLVSEKKIPVPEITGPLAPLKIIWKSLKTVDLFKNKVLQVSLSVARKPCHVFSCSHSLSISIQVIENKTAMRNTFC